MPATFVREHRARQSRKDAFVKKYIPILKRAQLFAGVDEREIASMLGCLQARALTFDKGSFVFRQGECLNDAMLLLEGKIHIQKDDYWGSRSILSVIEAGEMFGEVYVSPNSGALLNDVVAVEDSAVLFLDIRRALTACPSACRFHSRVIQNLFFAISDKNRKLVQKLEHMSRRSTREKLISYLSEEARRQNSGAFTIPFNRQQLADFLCVDRSAMSNELCKMRDDGLLAFEKNRFTLL